MAGTGQRVVSDPGAEPARRRLGSQNRRGAGAGATTATAQPLLAPARPKPARMRHWLTAH